MQESIKVLEVESNLAATRLQRGKLVTHWKPTNNAEDGIPSSGIVGGPEHNFMFFVTPVDLGLVIVEGNGADGGPTWCDTKIELLV